MTRMEVKLIAIIGGVILTSLIIDGDAASNKTRLTQQHYTAVPLQGFVQTPIGGTPKTSDIRRPNFAELGIKQIDITEQQLQIPCGSLIFYIAYQQIRPKNSLKLATPLLTYGRLFAKDTVFNTVIQFDYYRFGIALPLKILTKLQLTPKVELDVFDFDYRINTPDYQRGRNYHHLTLRSGFAAVYSINADFVVHYQRLQTPALFNALDIKSELFGFNSKALAINLAKQTQKIEFKDNQPLPNHLLLQTEAVYLSEDIKMQQN